MRSHIISHITKRDSMKPQGISRDIRSRPTEVRWKTISDPSVWHVVCHPPSEHHPNATSRRGDTPAPTSQALTQGHPDLTLFERGAGRQRRERNLRPLPRPMNGSNTAIERYLSQALVLSASSSKVCSQKNPWRVRLRQGHASRRS